MMFVKSTHAAAVAATALISAGVPKNLDVNQTTSILITAKTLAEGAMSYYTGTAQAYADLAQPYYWWECGALMGAMLDYSHYTADTTYDQVIATALLAQVGPDFDYMLPAHYGDEGNDDLAFWGFAVLAAAERNFPQPNTTVPSWLDLGQNLWNSLASRWNTTDCAGGLMWQIFPSNPNGFTYKNSVSNGGFFQISARLARATGNNTYLEWAEKIWDWSQGVGFIDSSYNVLDGASITDNCSAVNPVSFSYSTGIYMYGAAVLSDYTNDTKWTTRTTSLLDASKSFFSPFDNATNIMYEHACEQVDKCNTDMKSFKGYLSRFMYASTVYVPSMLPTVHTLLNTSANAAAQACTGGDNGTTCGQKWYTGTFDGSTGLGQEMSALETVQGLLVGQSTPPFKGNQIQVIRDFATTPTAATTTPSPTATATPTKRSSWAVACGADMRWTATLSALTGFFVWAMA
jgi:mannan endo-1,6-alpha-mannosidase